MPDRPAPRMRRSCCATGAEASMTAVVGVEEQDEGGETASSELFKDAATANGAVDRIRHAASGPTQPGI